MLLVADLERASTQVDATDLAVRNAETELCTLRAEVAAISAHLAVSCPAIQYDELFDKI